jgi:hypothetical protein
MQPMQEAPQPAPPVNRHKFLPALVLPDFKRYDQLPAVLPKPQMMQVRLGGKVEGTWLVDVEREMEEGVEGGPRRAEINLEPS